MGIVVGSIAGAFAGALIGAPGFALAETVFGRGIGIFGPSPFVGALLGAIMVGLVGCAAGAISGGFGRGRKWSGLAGGIIGSLAAIYTFSMHAAYFIDYGLIASISMLLGSVGASLAGGELSQRLVFRD